MREEPLIRLDDAPAGVAAASLVETLNGFQPLSVTLKIKL
jgi:hypothetical protein